MSRYLVIHTVSSTFFLDSSLKERQYIHFICLNKDSVFVDIVSFVNHLDNFKGQKVVKVEFSNEKMTNW